ncbi:uncharacterized protein N7498_001678 [Penicillium cinerascens]|uniref:Uncharacterized protein n=1 Tax=Penicillium cinerascens TaxID=70096 RepID=A0A9W9TAE3_9EURO|nr:uncharacterized protein N7498_001678 [Penicillium cinerascens]KAJ5215271.1 hypothetical protein N7498_001678 [Penicillium cinerascens]
MSDDRIISDDSSSIYSRSADSPKLFLTSHAAIALSAKHDLPEINSLDHQIAMAHGSTMALETTTIRLQNSKSGHRRSLPESRYEKLRQWEEQKCENEFFQSCLENFHEFSKSVIGVIQNLTPQFYDEPEEVPVSNLHVLLAVHLLREQLEKSRVQEAKAEQKWKSQWNLSRIWNPTSRWI